jgi:hypothetical protein
MSDGGDVLSFAPENDFRRLDTTGAEGLTVVVACREDAAVKVEDNLGNSYTRRANGFSNSGIGGQIWETRNPTVSSTHEVRVVGGKIVDILKVSAPETNGGLSAPVFSSGATLSTSGEVPPMSYGNGAYGAGTYGAPPEGTDSASPPDNDNDRDGVDWGEMKALIARDKESPINAEAALSDDSNVVRPLRWVRVARTPDLQEVIKELERLLPEVIRHSRFTNLSPDELGLTDDERRHVVELLETALAMLKGPLAEEGLLKAARDGGGRAVMRLSNEGPEKLLYVAGTLAIEHFDKILTLLGLS